MKDGEERTLSSSLEEYFVEHATDAMVLIDGKGRATIINRAAFELLGADAARQFDGSGGTSTEMQRFLDRLHAERRATAQMRTTTDAGAYCDLALEGVATETGSVIVLRDVTRIRALERELHQLQRFESARLLTASIVHDLNNLLTPILCLGELIKQAAPTDSVVATYSNDLVDAAERSANLVRQVLGFVRRGPVANERVHLGEVLTEMHGLLDRLAGDDIDLSLAIDPGLADARIAQEQLGHVVINLVVNARDAMPHGGRLSISAQNVTLKDGSVPMDYVALSVSDTGSGIAPEIRDRIFENFFTTKDPGAGTGIGLASAHRFVGEHGGKIAIESEPGRGTVVTLYFPRDEELELPVARAKETLEVPGGVETILVVDSDDRLRSAVRLVLEARGYTVLEAATGSEALTRMEHTSVDLVLADATLDDLPVTLLVEKCRLMNRAAVFMSGRSDHELSRRGPEVPRLVTLRKAFAPEHLARTIRDALDERDAAE